MIYLDYAAATPLDESVLAAMSPYFTNDFFNPSAIYQAARKVQEDVLAARKLLARILGCQSNEVVFTAGGTEADNLAIAGVMNQFPKANLIVSGLEHAAVLSAAGMYQYKVAAIKPSGVVDLDKLKDSIDDQTVLISVMWASNEIGTIQPIRKISKLVSEIRVKRRQNGNNLPLYVHSDASQASAWCDLNVNRSGLDLMTINGGKIYGPKQTGLLYVRRGLELSPLIKGGGHEGGLRSGSTNTPGVIGLAKSFEIVSAKRSEQSKRLAKLRDDFEKKLIQAVPAVRVNGAQGNRLPNFSSLTFNGVDGERLVMELDENGIMAATGAACSANSDEPSKALLAIGLSIVQANSSLRISLGYPTTKSDITQALSVIIKLTAKHYE
jgi:cysteine desulfurase